VSRRTVAWPVAIALAATTALMVARTTPPSPVPASAPATEFSAMRALRHVEAIAVEPHPTGSIANARVRRYILNELASLGVPAEEQPSGDLVNVVARIPGSFSSDAILLTAHYDSTPQSPGAADDSSGVAVLLETARALRAAEPPRNTVMFLFTDHEEGGLFGAKAFIAGHPWTSDVRVVVGFDAGGIGGPGVLSATSPDAGWLIRQWLTADPEVIGSSAINALATSSSDFGRAFRPAGFPGYAFDLYWDKRDGPEDDLASLALGSLQHQGGHALSLARHLGGLDRLAIPREPDIVFFNVLRVFTVSYPQAWAVPLALAIATALAGVVAVGLRRRRLSGRGLAYGAVVALVGAGLAPLPVVLLGLVAGPFVPGVTADWDYRLIDQPPVMAAIVVACLALVIAWHRLARRVRATSLADLTIGALLLLAAGLLGTSAVIPALSYGFAWPLLASTVLAAGWMAWAKRDRAYWIATIGLVMAGAVTIVVAGPSIVLGVFDQLPLALASLGALCAFLVPQLQIALGHPQEMV
jgi:hypothetical protein